MAAHRKAFPTPRGNGNCGEQWSSKVAGEAESHSRGYGFPLRAPMWADRAAAKPFSGERATLDLRGNRRHPLKGNPRRSVRQRLHEISGPGPTVNRWAGQTRQSVLPKPGTSAWNRGRASSACTSAHSSPPAKAIANIASAAPVRWSTCQWGG